MAGYFIVQLKTLKGRKAGQVFLVVDRENSYPIRIVNSKRAATKFETRGIASLVSDHFWEHYWKKLEERYNLDSREVVFVKKRG